MLLLCTLLVILQSVQSEITNLDVNHIADIITKSLKEVEQYKRSEDAYEYQSHSQTSKEYGTYDYIIVGAGSTGAVLATRLSENDNVTVLLLEAGGEETTFSDIPAMMMSLHGTKLNWNFKTVPQTTCCLGMVEQRCAHPRGKGLGGTSILNAAMYVRGNKDDFDSWAAAGNDGWSYNEVLPYFIKSENSQINGDPGYHGKGGLLNVEYHKPVSPVTQAFIEANQEIGRKVVDYNGRTQLGVSHTQFSTLHGSRRSTGKAFLATARQRNNLHVLKHSYATQVLINGKKEAFGVSFSHQGQTNVAKAQKDVILSAGAIGSPQLLLLSGVGPSEQLTSLGIPVVADLPVGKNYQDHPCIFSFFFTTNYSEPIKSLHEDSEDYLSGKGRLTIGANAQALAFFRTKSARTPVGVPDIEAIMIPQQATDDYAQQVFNYDNETFKTVYSTLDYNKTFAVFLMLLHPNSRGTISLKSSNPYEYPNIDINYLSDQDSQDIETLYEGINMVLEMVNTAAFRKIDAKLHYPVLPACRKHEYLSKEQWFCQIRHLTTHIFHPVGTCKMALQDKGGVVDKELKVHGVERLRVADTSIFPDSTSGHPNAPAIMIGEKLADMLLKG